MQRAYAWTFLVPAVAVVIEAIHGALPSPIAMIAVVLVIVGVAIVNLHARKQQRSSQTKHRTSRRTTDNQRRRDRLAPRS